MAKRKKKKSASVPKKRASKKPVKKPAPPKEDPLEKIEPLQIKSKGGRPEKEIILSVEKTVEFLSGLKATKEEVAAFLCISVDTLDRRYAEFFSIGRLRGKVKLRRAINDEAINKRNGRCLVFLAKNDLDMSENPDVDPEVEKADVTYVTEWDD